MSLSVLNAAGEEPTATALVLDERRYTFADLADLVRSRLSEGLPGQSSELPSPDRPPLALLCSYGIDTVVTLMSAVEAGIPVLLLDPRSSPEESERLIEMCGAVDLREADSRGPDERHRSTADRNCLAVIATSGSAGRPKAVALSRRAFVAAAKASAANLGWKEDDRWLLSLPLAHVGGLSILIRCLSARKGVVWERPRRFSAERFVEVVENHHVTLVSLVPTMLERMLRMPRERSLRDLRVMLVGGADCPRELLQRAAARGWPVLTTYGSTETCSQIATQKPGTSNVGDLGCGPPLQGVSVRVRDGRIEVSGATLFSGYVGGKLRSPADWFRCGDRGRFDRNGNLHVLGRADSVIVSGGELVSAREVEEVVGSVDGIEWVSAYGVTDREWGEAVAIAITIESRNDTRAILQQVNEACSRRLARYKRPKRFVLVEERARPMLINGKIDRLALRELPTVEIDRSC